MFSAGGLGDLGSPSRVYLQPSFPTRYIHSWLTVSYMSMTCSVVNCHLHECPTGLGEAEVRVLQETCGAVRIHVSKRRFVYYTPFKLRLPRQGPHSDSGCVQFGFS